ncbi:restriction endonuclease [Planctomycetales bacterium]|nr:restriction endonuclease [Planctomycetales bacterium]
MKHKKISETITENIFRDFYAATTFIEKSAIPQLHGFQSKKQTGHTGYPDFFREEEEYVIVVEAKPTNHNTAREDIQYYMNNNNVKKDIIGIAVSGQTLKKLDVSYFVKIGEHIQELQIKNTLLQLFNIHKLYRKLRYGESISNEGLKKILTELNNQFQETKRIADTERSLFFSGLMIALTDNTFRSTYKGIAAPSKSELSVTQTESHHLNDTIIDAITRQLSSKINNLSKEFSWRDRFAFIKNIDYSLNEYKDIIAKIEDNIFNPFQNEEKQDVLGKAYLIFLSRSGKIDNRNIIITPNHIKGLMVKLANLNVKDVVLDTCTGTGGFLLEAMEQLLYLASGNENLIKNIKERQLIGFELDSVLFSLACSNMFLHGDGKTNMLYRSSLLDDDNENIINSTDEELMQYIRSLKPTKCIINPPYENNYAFRFTKQAIEYLEPNGRLIIIMPNNTLTRNQGKTQNTENLLKQATLDYVITMPDKLFSEQKRTVFTAIFGFTKAPHPQNKEVMFYHLEDDGLVSVQHKGRIDKNNLWDNIENQILDAIANGREIDDVCEKKKIYKDGILNVAGSLGTGSAKLVQIKDIFTITKGKLASEDNEDGEYDFITAAEKWKTHSSFTHDCEAIIFAAGASGSLGRTHFINGKFIASNLCFVLKPKNQSKFPVNLQFYNAYFTVIRRKLVKDIRDGKSKIVIKKTDLENYYIDYIPIESQNALLPDIVELKKKKNDLKQQIIKMQEQTNKNILKLL